jgi:hypothetical protein
MTRTANIERTVRNGLSDMGADHRKTSASLRTSRQRAVLLSAALYVWSAPMVQAKDLKPIADFIRPAYSAMNLVMLCARDDPRFLKDTRGPRGDAFKYAEHIRNEAIDSLSKDDALAVLTLAADGARDDARKEFRKIVPTPTYSYPQIARWCRGYVLEFVRTVTEKHDSELASLLKHLDDEKRRLRLKPQ